MHKEMDVSLLDDPFLKKTLYLPLNVEKSTIKLKISRGEDRVDKRISWR